MTIDLINRARTGDGDAFRELMEPHRRELQAHCYRMLGSLQDAEDTLQETLLAAWQGLGEFEGRASMRTWLYRIATNRCLNALRSASRRPARHWDLPEVEPPEPPVPPEVLPPAPVVPSVVVAASRPAEPSSVLPPSAVEASVFVPASLEPDPASTAMQFESRSSVSPSQSLSAPSAHVGSPAGPSVAGRPGVQPVKTPFTHRVLDEQAPTPHAVGT